jgi:hypothetical protein
MALLTDALLEAGLDERAVGLVMGANAMRCFKEVLPAT